MAYLTPILGEFEQISQEFEHLAKLLSYEDGDVKIYEYLREGHEVVFGLIGDQVKDQYTAAVGRRTVKCLGSHDIKWGPHHTARYFV